MLYFLLICFIFILAFSLFSIIRTIRNINKQIKQQRKIRVSLSNRDIEELAYAINQKDNLHKKLQVSLSMSFLFFQLKGHGRKKNKLLKIPVPAFLLFSLFIRNFP